MRDDSLDPCRPDRLFPLHRPKNSETVDKLDLVRREFEELAWSLRAQIPACPERTLCMRALREAMMNAIFAIVAPDASELPSFKSDEDD